MAEPARFRRFGVYVVSDCDDWNAGYRPGERDEVDDA